MKKFKLLLTLVGISSLLSGCAAKTVNLPNTPRVNPGLKIQGQLSEFAKGFNAGLLEGMRVEIPDHRPACR